MERKARLARSTRASKGLAAVRFAAGPVVEMLEGRRYMAGVIINEFLAENHNGIVDQDNDHSDWIELRNTDSTAVNLSGWSLTDDPAIPGKWHFPSTTIAGNGYLLVWASGKNRAVAGQELHTNFSLDSAGETLELVKPDGVTIADSYAPYPEQTADVSYGRGSSGTVSDTLIDTAAQVKWKVPTAASSIDSTWKNSNFVPDGTWTTSTTGVGYDTNTSGTNYLPYIGAGSNTQSQMSGFTRSVYMLLNFNVADPSVFTSLHLKMLYDDGFGVYLNGTRLNGTGGEPNAERAAPATLVYNSLSTSSRTDSDAIVYEDIDITTAKNLLVAGNNVLAIQGLNTDPTSSDLLQSPLLLADRGLVGTAGYMATPSPGAANNVGTLGFVGDTHFSVDRGFFSAPFTTTITTNTVGAQIRYTLDGSVPTATTGLIYSAPIQINTTATLRAAAFKTGWTPTNVDTETYVFLNDVIHQTGTGLPAFATWGHNGPDWAMDPNVVNNSTYSGTIVNDLQAVPSVSLVMPWGDWFGANGQGIYPSGSGIEKATSMEMINASDATQDFQSDAAVEIQGASSSQRWNNDKLSFRLTFKPPFGPSKLDASIFTNPTLDKGATTKFDRLILDSMYDDSWMDSSSANRAHAKEVQDQYAADLQNLAGGNGPHGKFVQLYLNGLYWGMYYLHEEPDDSFAESYFGGSKDDYDVVKHNASTIVAGGSGATTDYNNMLTATSKDLTVLTNYNAVANLLDLTAFADYMIVNEYIGNTDWASHNWYASRSRVDPKGKWRFQSWDAEISLRDVNTNNTTFSDSGAPTQIQMRLEASPEYKLLFADEVQRLTSNGGLLTPAVAGAMYQLRVNEINQAIVGESARWGDNHSGNRYLQSDWRATQDGLQVNYFPQRTGVLLGQYTTRGWLATLGSPTYSPFGGTVTPGSQVTISKPSGSPAGAVIYYTLDGSDPRLAGGAINTASATQYAGPITLNVARRIKARVYNPSGSTWSAVIDATFLMPTLFPVRISELHYHPGSHVGVADPDTAEFIELVNTGTSTVSLQNVSLTKFATNPYVFGSGISLTAGQRIVVVQNMTSFQTVYGNNATSGINVAPVAYGSANLSNSGEEIALLGSIGETLQDFTYGDSNVAGWPASPDGDGPSLEINDPLGDPGDPHNWHASFVIGGTPGTVAPPPTALASSFQFNTAQAVAVQFDHDMDQTSFATTDINITLQPSGTIFHPTSVTFTDSKDALFNFATPLADGNYHATLTSGSVKDTAGQPIGAASDLDFFVLNGDANHDRHVDAADQAILTAHLNQAGTFSTGDFDLNGTVNSADQAILTAQLKLWLPPVGALSLTATSGDDAYKLRKESSALIDIYAGTDVTPTYRLINGAVTSLSFAGGTGNDTLVIDASNGLPMGSIPLSFDGGNVGSDAVSVIGTTGADAVTFNSTSIVLGSTIVCSGVEVRSFDGDGGGDSLTINDVAVALATSQKLSSLTLNPNATLDMRDRALVIDYTGGTPMSTVAGEIQIGRDGGAWDRAGIVTSQSAAKLPSSVATLGIAEASDVVHFGASATAVWNGQTVDKTAVLIRYTFAGDSTLDGVINGDDYFNIDSHAGPAGNGLGYESGDFNFDGKINGDDYFLIDSNYNKAQAPLAALPLSLAGPALPPANLGQMYTENGFQEPAPIWDDWAVL